MAFLVSITEDEVLRPDVINDAEFKSIPFIDTNEHDSIDNANGTASRAFLFLDADENLQMATPELFCKKLKCQELDKIKVISIFGNTGDGKSHTMNQVFFDGEPVFRTSPEQSSCTIGVYAAMQREQGVLCLDTEGLLGTTAKSSKRMRMLLKILAISDIVVYRTRSERLHSDMYEFLGTASKAFCLHFTQALQAMGNGSTLGPAVIIFHETHYTKPLESSVEESAEDKLRNSFALLNYETNAFSSLRYVGIQTDAKKSTNFKKISDALRLEIENTAVRSPRQPSVVFKAMKLLNQKFAGEIIEKAINPFPEQYFTCGAHCESCSRRCQRSMGHVSDGESHFNTQPCNYQHQYENKLYLCKACYNNGKEIVVSIRAQSQTDTAWSGLAKYVWKGDVIECPYCGEIYRARQYWYGNKSPEASVVHVQVVHVWKGGNAALRANVHSAQMVLDSVNSISEAFTNISAPWAKAISGMLADKVAPSYWRPNQEIILCHACKRNFEKTGMPKHHCRGCGEGFCHTCSQHRVPVPARGWLQPVRVCNDCHQQLQRKSDTTPVSSFVTHSAHSRSSCIYLLQFKSDYRMHRLQADQRRGRHPGAQIWRDHLQYHQQRCRRGHRLSQGDDQGQRSAGVLGARCRIAQLLHLQVCIRARRGAGAGQAGGWPQQAAAPGQALKIEWCSWRRSRRWRRWWRSSCIRSNGWRLPPASLPALRPGGLQQLLQAAHAGAGARLADGCSCLRWLRLCAECLEPKRRWRRQQHHQRHIGCDQRRCQHRDKRTQAQRDQQQQQLQRLSQWQSNCQQRLQCQRRCQGQDRMRRGAPGQPQTQQI
ncbi:zinc finger FYVE domain-containing protein 1-like isoform X2 [Drosophila novamexicana]|uniref:zinc finger FYVE domain-containing protein 1-like isoform X2 n=1 Tax=Drosophila novamexicana TaxID=47314 RepID=UPI0011E590DE|nr:zinc finger FYVE domain-containing protein 1-like isoform X2 [Drosophila novamexicana]